MTFQPASWGIDHALVACDLTQMLVEVSSCRWGYLISLIDVGALLFDLIM